MTMSETTKILEALERSEGVTFAEEDVHRSFESLDMDSLGIASFILSYSDLTGQKLLGTELKAADRPLDVLAHSGQGD